MQSQNQTVLVILLLLAGLLPVSRAEDAAADFKWFSGLGFPDVASCPYIRVATGQWSQMGSGPRQNQYVNGFLLTTNGPTFRVLTLDLLDETLTNSVDGTNEYNRVGFERLDLKTEADVNIQSLRIPIPGHDDWSMFSGEPYSTKRTQTFVLGWACWRQGLNNEAGQLYKEAQKLKSPQVEGATNSFHKSIEKDLAYTMIWRATVCFGEPSISRPQLLARFDSVAKNYPDSEYHDEAARTAGMLRKMIVEDEIHAKTVTTNLDELPVEGRVHELIFRLRDQNGHQYGQPGSCDIFDDVYRKSANTNTPAHQLVRIGYAAVTQLIAALEDPTPIRSVGCYTRAYIYPHNILTVGDCAEAILKRITGRSFSVYRSGYTSRDGLAAANQKAAEAWWGKFQEKGEKEMLIEAVSAPDNDAPDEADILCKRYPDVAAPTLIRGVTASTNDSICTSLIRRLGAIDRPEAKRFLAQEMTNSPMLACRVAAANIVRRSDKEAALTAMIGEWQKFRAPSPYDKAGGIDLIEFLAGSDSPKAIEALAQGIRQRTVDTRLTIVQDMDPHWLSACVTNSPDTSDAVEEFLVKELEDTDERMGLSGSRYGKDYFDPRICDMAGEVLAELYAKRYAFDLSASLKVCDRQRIQCINIWRQAHGLALLPLPMESSVHVKPEQATQVTKIEWMDGSVKPGAEFATKIESFNGKPLDPSGIVAILVHYVIAPEPETGGLEFKAIKDEDLTGVRLLVCLIPSGQSATSNYFSDDDYVVLTKRSLHQSDGGGIRGFYSQLSAWAAFANAITQAMAAKPEVPFYVRVRVGLGDSI